MRVLLDTNVLIWFAQDSEYLSPSFRETVLSHENEIFVSMASLWEISIKHSLGKLKLNGSLSDFFTDIENDFLFILLPVEKQHLLALAGLPFHHRDPFDRLIWAQNIVENMTLLYTDKVFDLYK